MRRFGIGVLACILAHIGSGCGESEPAPYRVRSQRGDAGNDTRSEPSDDGQGDAAAVDPQGRGAGTRAGAGTGGNTGDAGGPRIAPGGCEGGPILRVLFVGNSHTFTNDLPSLVRELTCAAGTQVITQSATPGGVGFIEHAVDPNTLAAIEADAWDLVIMQDQQQRPGIRLEEIESDHLPAFVSLVDAIARHRAATRPLLFMVWARVEGDTTNCAYYPLACSFETSTLAVSQGYRLYAERTGAAVAPVALAWAAARADPDAPLLPTELWNPDGYHPALPGSYLAAAVLVGTVLAVPTTPLAFDGGLTPELAAYLRGVADRIVRDDRADDRLMTPERVRIECVYGGACSAAADATAVTFSLSTDDCDALSTGAAQVRARIHTTLGCRGACTTVALGDWHQLDGETIEDGDYQVHAHVDVNGDGELGEGDLEACSPGNLVVGSGDELLFDELQLR